jgi:hypothetical protein
MKFLVRPVGYSNELLGESPAYRADYDIFIATIGYETRATYIHKQLADRVKLVVSAPLTRTQSLSFEKNERYFSRKGEVLSGEDSYLEELREIIHRSLHLRRLISSSEPPPVRICVDISSMNRQRLADTVRSLHVDSEVPVDVDWLYAPAKFSPRLIGSGPVQFNDAISGFEGWADPVWPLHAIVGLGLEGSLVLGVLDDLEPAETWIFEPTGLQDAYDRRIERLNSDVFDVTPVEHRFSYDVTQPFTSFLKLSALIDELTVSERRVVLIPLGPKIFALMCMLVGAGNRADVSVWRLSTASEPPVDRIATGHILGLRGISLE